MPPKKAPVVDWSQLSPHQHVLQLLNEAASPAEIAKSTKRISPPHILIAFVGRTPADKLPRDVAVALGTFRVQVEKADPRKAALEHPTALAWFVVSPSGSEFAALRWARRTIHTVPTIRRFCDATGRRFAFYNAETGLVESAPPFRLLDAKLIHQDQLVGDGTRKEASPANAVTLANRLLSAPRCRSEELAVFELLNDEAAHDEATHERFTAKVLGQYQQRRQQLAKKFGQPAQGGETEHKDIPCNGVLRYAIWDVQGKRLYLVALHEDRELPYVLQLGTAEPGTGRAKSSRRRK